VLLLAIVVVAGSAVAAPLRTPLLGNLRYRCTLGFERTNASVTMRGPFAGHECRQLLDQTKAFPVRIFTTSHIANAPVVCSFTESHVKVTVRDDGVLQLLGDNLCTVIRNVVADGAAIQKTWLASLPDIAVSFGADADVHSLAPLWIRA